MAARFRVPPFDVFPREDRPKRLAPPVPYQHAHDAADRRRLAIRSFLDQYKSELFAPRFRDTSPTSQAQDRLLEGAAAAAQAARLRWQRGSDLRLLLDQVCDALQEIRFSSEASMTVSLQPLPARDRIFTDALPWRVVIEGSDPNVCGLLLETGFRPSIAVDFIETHRRFVPFNYCRQGSGGLAGVVGGLMTTRMEPRRLWAATCRHVISDGCCSQAYPAGKWIDPGCPDAVLLSVGMNCFEQPAPVSVAASISDFDAMRLQLEQVPLTRQHPKIRFRRGYIRYPVGAICCEGRFIQFPHFSVRRYQWTVGPLRVPFGPFAAPGDSGSWVFEEGTRLWVGMIVGGYDGGRDVAAADGRALLDYFSCLVSGTADPPSNERLVPYAWP